jgi:predicted HAD superfamily Cof-like phosphohydrolase
MKDAIEAVTAFHRACGMPVKDAPEWPSTKRIRLRYDLVLEECDEFYSACLERDMPAAADALADLIYVAIGAALEFGIPLEAVWAEVQRANMAKVDPATSQVRRREDGKILKPEGWEPPDVARVLYEHGGPGDR